MPNGFTLIELLIAVSIIGLLAAISLVALSRSRETVRRSVCQNNLRQWGMALHSYCSAVRSWPPAVIWSPPGEPLGHGVYPVGVIDRVATQGDLQGDTIFANWAVMLLPHLGHTNIAFSFDPRRPISDPVNASARQATLAVAACPSDSYNTTENLYSRALPAGDDSNRYARGNYGINAGPDNYCIHSARSREPCVDGFFVRFTDLIGKNDQAWGSGVSGINKCFRPSDVVDGLSHTVAVDEIRAGLYEYDPRGVWALGQIGSSIAARHGKFDQHIGLGQNGAPDEIVNAAILIEDLGLERLEREGMTCDQRNQGLNTRVASRSMHPHGVNVLLCDGAVLFIEESIDLNLWHAKHTRDGKEASER